MAKLKSSIIGQEHVVQAQNKGGEGLGSARYTISGTTATLESIWVYPQKRGKGVGGRLLDQVMHDAAENGAKQLTGELLPELGSNPDHAIRLYKSRGLTIDSNNKINGSLERH
jgi:GNAT superfamily N-acetyltransferase